MDLHWENCLNATEKLNRMNVGKVFHKNLIDSFKFTSIVFSYLEIDEHHNGFLYAAFAGDVRTVERLLQNGVPVDVSNEYGWTALHRAAKHNREDIAKQLLQAAADVNKQTNNGDTPLHWAAFHNSHDVARLLVEGGADMSLMNKWNQTPLDRATGNAVRSLLFELQ